MGRITKDFRGYVGTVVTSTGATAPSLFCFELDGDTAPDPETAARWKYERREAEAEIAAEVGYERFLETNDQYRWEVEEDERRAAAFSF